jgi:hypothetical protein
MKLAADGRRSALTISPAGNILLYPVLDNLREMPMPMLRPLIAVLIVAGQILAFQSAPAGGGASLKVDEILTLLEAKMPEAVILSKIKSAGHSFNLSTEDLVRLKKAGASEAVLLGMMSPAAAASPAATSAPAPATAAGAHPQFAEVGVYYKKQDQWMELLPEVINWKTGGALKTFGTAGIVKKDVNGHIPGPHSRNSVHTPLEFTIFAPEGVAITEYQLIRLRAQPDKDYREFRTVTGGVFNQKSGAMRDMVPFEGKKVGNRLYTVVLPNNLGSGEYGFVYMGATGTSGGLTSMSMGKMYTFRMLE